MRQQVLQACMAGPNCAEPGSAPWIANPWKISRVLPGFGLAGAWLR
jgi:hypothetical protein